jgi:hypothetical protein
MMVAGWGLLLPIRRFLMPFQLGFEEKRQTV